MSRRSKKGGGARTSRRANTKTKVIPPALSGKKSPEFRFPPRTKYHPRKPA